MEKTLTMPLKLSLLAALLVSSSASYAAMSGNTMDSSTKPLFGELHMHTSYSFDAFIFQVRSTPEEAYNFAKGQPLKHPLGQTYQLTRPLDFLAVTDHGAYMGAIRNMANPEHPYSKLDLATKILNPDPDVFQSGFTKVVESLAAGEALPELVSDKIQKDTWDVMIDSANEANDPGKFTAFIAYEWTSAPDGQNLHRNVIFKGDTAPQPFTVFDSSKPEDLWAWMDTKRKEGHEALAIPHNGNLSDGRMFERQDSWDKPFNNDYAERRMRNEPLVEITQVKGTSETHPILSPNDEFADFELVEQYVARNQPVTRMEGSYVRNAYRRGLEFQDDKGFNPYRFGLIGASDSHTGISPVVENDYSGKVGAADGSPQMRMQAEHNSMDLRFFSASGLAGVWAKENTRESIYDAMRRKETWATSGPRITVRFFASFDKDALQPGQDGWVDKAYKAGVPMGGSLKGSDKAVSPTFGIWAIKDAESASLDRIQIVKGWSENGKSHEKVYNIAWAGDRKADMTTGKIPAVANTVNLDTLAYDNSVGAVQLQGTWTDPAFNAKQNAFYYARVIEIPTPRWSTFDAKELGIEYPEGLDKTIQERAYTSPIWYDHH
jgi:hypothetical protein